MSMRGNRTDSAKAAVPEATVEMDRELRSRVEYDFVEQLEDDLGFREHQRGSGMTVRRYGNKCRIRDA